MLEGDPVCLGAYRLERGPAVACAVIRPAKGDTPRRAILVWTAVDALGRTRCWLDRGAVVPSESYMGDPNGEPGPVNGDHPWMLGPASEESVQRGLSLLRAGSPEPTSGPVESETASPAP